MAKGNKQQSTRGNTKPKSTQRSAKPQKQTGTSPKPQTVDANINLQGEKAASKVFKDILVDASDLTDLVGQLNGSWGNFGQALQNTVKSSEKLGENFSEVEDLGRKIFRNLESVGSKYYEHLNVSNRINQVTAGKAKIEEKIEKINGNLEQKGKSMHAQKRADLKLERSALETEKESLNALEKQLQSYKEIADTLDRANDHAKKLGINIETVTDEVQGVFKDAMSQLEKLPGGGVLGKFFGVNEKLEQLNSKIFESFVSGMAKGQSTGVAALGALATGAKAFMATLLPIAGTIAAIAAAFFIVKKALDVDSETATMAKNLGISKDEAKEAHHTAIELSMELEQTGINAKEVGKAMEDLSSSTGLNVAVLSGVNEQIKSIVAGQAMMTQYSSITSEEFGNLTDAAALLNTDVNALAAAAMSFGDELVSGDALLKDIAKVSKTVLINFSKNPKELIKAVKQAKMLGLELNQVAAAGDSLLNIESSLEAEMTANVLTGRKMNMNKARQLALDGDIAGLQEEIAKQAGLAADYEEMRPYQRKAFAAALGMEVDQVDTMMKQQKLMLDLGYSQEDLENKLKLTGSDRAAELDRILKTKGKEAELALRAKYDEEDRVSTQERLADIGNKIADSAAKLGTVLLPVIEGFGKIADNAFVIYGILGSIAGLMVGRMLAGTISLYKQFAALLVAKKQSLATDETSLLTQESQAALTATETGEKMIQAPLDVESAGSAVTEAGAVGAQVLEEGVLTGEKAAQAVADVTSATAKKQGLRATLQSIGAQIRATIAAGTEAAAKVTSAIASTFGGAALTIIPAILGAIGAIGAYIYMNDGVIGPANGYSRVMSGPEGSIAFNDKDTIVAGTNLNQSSSSSTEESSATTQKSSDSSNSELVKLMRELIQKIDQPVKISIGNRVIDEMETMMSVRKSYVTKVDKGYGAFG